MTDSFEAWYNCQPFWLRLVLVPFLIIAMVAYNMVAIPIFLLVILPYLTIAWWVGEKRLWRKLRQQGQVVRWAEAETQIVGGNGTLIIEMTPTGMDWIWLISRPQADVDPQHVVPSWRQCREETQWELINRDEVFKSVESWTVERLGAFESSAKALLSFAGVAAVRRLDGLGIDAKKSILVVNSYHDQRLSQRLKRQP